MKTYTLRAEELRAAAPTLRAGDKVLLSGVIYTARDAAHKRLKALMDAVIYYSGATPAPEGLPIGACGPTTSGRMDIYTPRLHDAGLCATIGKGERSPEVVEAIRRCGGVYLCALGGAGALAAKSVASCRVIAFEDLGCEAVKRMEVRDFPLIVGIDCHGGNLFAGG